MRFCQSCGKVYEETDDPGNGLAFDCRACVGSLVRARDFALQRRGFDPLHVMAWQMMDAAIPLEAAEVFAR